MVKNYFLKDQIVNLAKLVYEKVETLTLFSIERRKKIKEKCRCAKKERANCNMTRNNWREIEVEIKKSLFNGSQSENLFSAS